MGFYFKTAFKILHFSHKTFYYNCEELSTGASHVYLINYIWGPNINYVDCLGAETSQPASEGPQIDFRIKFIIQI